MFEQGVFAFPIVYPMVAKEKARIRTIMNSGLTQSDLDYALGVFESTGREMKIILTIALPICARDIFLFYESSS